MPTCSSCWRSVLIVALGCAAAVGYAGEGAVLHRDALGFSVRMPADWIVAPSTRTDIALGDAAGDGVALVRARVARGDLGNWLERDYPRTEPGMAGVRVLRVERVQPQVARALIEYTNARGVAKRASVLAVRQGELATVFVAAAPVADFARRLAGLTQMLDSLRFEPVPAAAPAEPAHALRYVSWVEPREKAFSVELPAGWQVEGGLQRTTWNLRVAMRLSSPDGAVQVFIGDAQAPRMFIMPSATILSLGNREGVYGGPDSTMILRYQPARDYAADYVRTRLQGEATGASERADLLQLVQRNPLLQMQPSMASAADVGLRLRDGRTGFVGVATYGTVTRGVGGNWWADHLQGVVAPPARMAEAASVLAHLIASARWNPQWAAGERQFQATLNRQYQDYLQHSRQLQQQTIEARWASDAARQREVRDLLGNTVRLRDPVTGETFETGAGERYFYRVVGANQPAAVGTNADFNPVPQLDMRRLLQMGVDLPDR